MSCAVFTLLGMWVLYANKSNAWALQATFGLAGFCFFWACFLAWRDEERKVKELTAKLAAIGALPNSVTEHHIHLPAPPPSLPEPLKHNVQCVGVEIGPDFPIVRMCFRNIETPGKPFGSFRSARLKVNYISESSGEEIAEVFPVRWIGFDEDKIEIGVKKQCAEIARQSTFGWEALSTRAIPGEIGGREYTTDSTYLPSERLKIVATLIGENNLSLDKPIEGILALDQDGSASFTRT